MLPQKPALQASLSTNPFENRKYVANLRDKIRRSQDKQKRRHLVTQAPKRLDT
jgi:hypothetical protein